MAPARAPASSCPSPPPTTTPSCTPPPLHSSFSTSSPLEGQGGHQPLFGYEPSTVIENRASNSSSVLAEVALAADFELFCADYSEVASAEEGIKAGGIHQGHQPEMEDFHGSELLHFLEAAPVSVTATPQMAKSGVQSFGVETASKETSVSNAADCDLLAGLNATRPAGGSETPSEAPLFLPVGTDGEFASLVESPGMLAAYASLLADPYLHVSLSPQSLDTTTLFGRHDRFQQEPTASPSAEDFPEQNEEDPFAFLDRIVAPHATDAPVSPALSVLQTFEIIPPALAFPSASAASTPTSATFTRTRRPRITVKPAKTPTTVKCKKTPKPLIPTQLVHTPNDILNLPKDAQCNDYVCPWPHCGQRASRRYNLKVHYMTHLPIGTPGEEIESHACGICGKLFRRRFDVARHLKSLHREEEGGAVLGENVSDRRRKKRAFVGGFDLQAGGIAEEEIAENMFENTGAPPKKAKTV